MSGQTILNGRYHLLTQYASGGMAVIYKAMDLSLQRTVAVKILRPSLTVDPQFIARFQNEARAIANLAHPNIVTVHDVGTDVDAYGKATHYIIMEFVEGQDVKKLIRAQGALNVDKALNFAIQICAGIGFAHRTGIVHADIKPQNILLNKDQMVKITDFGIAQAWSDTQPQQKEAVVWGSPHYYAPEQARGEKPTAASDVYSIGIVIFEMLTGRVPYLGNNQQELALAHIRERIPLANEVNPVVPQELAQIIQRAMAKEPNDRFRMADQLRQVLITYRDKGRENTLNVVPPARPASGNSRPNQPTSVPGGTTTPPPPPVSLPTQPRQAVPPQTLPPQNLPSQPAPPPVSNMPPTQRYNVAPDAPGQNPFNRPPLVPTQPPVQQPYAPAPNLRGDSGYITPQQYSLRSQSEQLRDVPSVLDGVTVALMVLAFVAVACLIPLYIAVFSALSA
ncbi:MAG: protein kinase [Anaerolineae bacterium]|nr:protein kinase [Anaerolineae bacterium]